MGPSGKESEIRRAELAAAVTRAASGDQQALRFVYDATSAKLFGVVLRILKDRSEAEDVLQEVYLTIWRKGATFDSSRASPISWLVAIARNRAIDRLRSGSQLRRSASLDEAAEVPDLAPLASDRLEAEGESRKLSGCLDELEERQSQAPWRCGNTCVNFNIWNCETSFRVPKLCRLILCDGAARGLSLLGQPNPEALRVIVADPLVLD